MKKKILMGLAAAFAALTAQAQQAWKNTSLSFHERAKSLVAAMTLDEKIGQVGHQTAEISRLGLKGYNYWSEALHGVARSAATRSRSSARRPSRRACSPRPSWTRRWCACWRPASAWASLTAAAR